MLIVIRGNSNSGKTTLANRLQARLGTTRCLVLHQDQIRRALLHAPDTAGTSAVSLIATLIAWGREHYPVVVLEGILRADVYGAMLQEAITAGPTRLYYLDVPFELTKANDATRPHPFGVATLRRWWREMDVLGAGDVRLKPGGDWVAEIMQEAGL